MKIPLIRADGLDRLIATGDQQSISAKGFLESAQDLANQFENTDYVVNLCRDRYNFLLVFSASLIAGKTSIHPPNKQVSALKTILSGYPNNLCISDEPDSYSGLECMNLNEVLEHKEKVQADTIETYAVETYTVETQSIDIPEIDAAHLAAIAFTSGSTGKPTANRKTWGIFVGTTERLARRYGFYDSAPVIVGTVPSQHMYGLEMTILMALHGNCTIHRKTPFFPKDVGTTLDSLDSKKVLVTTPVHLRALVESGTTLSPLELIVSATAPLSIELAEKAEALAHCPLKEIYGCTEGGSIATRQTTKESTWKLLEDMTIRHDPQNKIILTAKHLAEEVTLQDELVIHSDDEFEFIGRNEDILNVGGKRYSAADLVLKLLEIEGVKDAFVFVPERGEKEGAKVARPAALVVSDITDKQIIKILSEKIDPVFIPRPVRLVNQIPRNETGKVEKQQLETLLKADQSGL